MLTTLLVIGLFFAVLLILLCALLFIPVTLRIKLRNASPDITLFFWGIPIRLFPKKKKIIKKPTKKKPITKEVPKPSSFLGFDQNPPPQDILRYIYNLLNELIRFIQCGKTKLYALKITPPGMDAAEAALCHTAITGGVAALLELLDNHTNLVIMSRDAIETSPNFTNKHPYFALHLSLSFAPYRALASLARFAERLQNI